MALKTFYHGTDIDSAKEICQTKKVDVKRGSFRTDFGQGFYVTPDYNRAVNWARRKACSRCNKAAVVTVLFDEDLNGEYPVQYAFHTEKAIEFIKGLSYRMV